MIFFNLKVKNAISLEDILSQYSVKDESERMAIEEAEAISRKAVLCGILKRVNKDSFDITLSFMEAIKIAGEFLDEFPEIKNVYCNENSYETDRQGLMLVIELYLAYRRMTERQRQGSRSVLAIDLFDPNCLTEIAMTK